MEEKKKYWQEPWWQAGFKTEDNWLNWWVSMLEKSISETQTALNQLKQERWESEPQLANFIQYLCEYTDSDNDHCAIARVIPMCLVQNTEKDFLTYFLSLELRGNNGKFYKCPNVKDFLLSYVASGKKWYEIARETSLRLVEIMNIAKKIRRNLLYSEVAEMEWKIITLESAEYHLRDTIEYHCKRQDELKLQLTGKEEEIAKLKNNIQAAEDRWRITQQLFENERNQRQGIDTRLAEKEKELKFTMQNRDTIICSLRDQLTALHIEHDELKKQHSDRAVYLAEKEKENESAREIIKNLQWEISYRLDKKQKELETQLAEKEKEIEKNKQHGARIEFLEYMIERTIIVLNQTKKFFKSKTIAQIRWELINILPVEKQTKFIGIQPPKPWPVAPPRPKECKTCNNTRKIACPACGDSKINEDDLIGDCACCKGNKKIDCPDCNPLPPQGGNVLKPIEPENVIIKGGKLIPKSEMK